MSDATDRQLLSGNSLRLRGRSTAPSGPSGAGAFEIDLKSGELYRADRRVPLQEKPFQLLVALLETPGVLVSRETLRDKLWSDVFVDFDGNLNAAVKKLREALEDSATSPRYVETVPRRGYRLIARVEPTPPPSEETPATPTFHEPAAGRPSRRRLHGSSRATLAGAMALALALAVATVNGWLRPKGSVLAPLQGDASTAASAQSDVDGRVMLAVMPFENLSGDPSHDYLSDGMTEELLTVLGRLRPDRLGVIARITAMTYKGTAKSIAEIGRELGVAYVLEGSVRGTSDHTRITAQLIAVADQTHLWADTYDAEMTDLLAVEAEIARRIAHALALKLLIDDPLATSSLATSVPAAYDHYLRGRHQWNRFTTDGNVSAIAELKRAIALDPTYAQAHAALADAYNLHAFDDHTGDGHTRDGDSSPTVWFTRARRSAEHALALDPDLAEAHNSLAFAVLYGEYNPATADPIFRRARELAPNYAMSYHWHAGALAALGRHNEAIAAVQQALELDPLSLSVKSDLGWYYLFAGRWGDAVRECQATLEMSPGYGWAMTCLIEAEIQAGNLEQAARHAQRQLRASEGERSLPDIEDLPAAGAMEAIWHHHLESELEKGDTDADPLWRAILYHRLSQSDQAIDWLERAFQQHEPWLVFLRVDPRFGRLRGHPRFGALASRHQLPEATPTALGQRTK